MTQTILGVLIGIVTSFIVGIFLIWKGNQLVHYLRRQPTKRRVAIFARAYLIALQSYPYRYAHLFTMTGIAICSVILFLTYGILTFVAFTLDFSLPPDELKRSFRLLIKTDFGFTKTILSPWFLLSATLFLAYAVRRIVFVTIPPEMLVPYAHRELTRVRECVAKCGTNKQFLEYTDAEHGAETLDDLRKLIILAKTILGRVDLKLADEILKEISTDLPKPINDKESQSEDQPARS